MTTNLKPPMRWFFTEQPVITRIVRNVHILFELFLFLALHIYFVYTFLAEIDECIEKGRNESCLNGATCNDLVCSSAV